MKQGVLTVISGFSGAGKGTIMKELIDKYDYFLSISATTRQPREGEQDGVHYHFVSREQFENMISQGDLIEWAEYVGNYYGTPKKFVEEQLAKGKDVLLEIEMQGGMLVKKQFPDALLLFVTPPTADDLKTRLSGRGTETEEQIAKRLKRASEEVVYMNDYEYIIVNDILENAVQDIHSLIQSQHNKKSNCNELIEKMNQELKKYSEGE